jgi:ER lumen protein retaining receptor
MLLNPFRILGDVSHIVSKCILIWSIHTNKSAEGEYCLPAIVGCCL